MTSVRKKDIRAAFGRAGLSKVNDDIVSKCIALATTTRVSPDQMALCWEAFSLNRQLTELNEHCFESFRVALLKYSDDAPKDSTMPDHTVSSRPVKRASPPSVTPPAKRNQTHPTLVTSSSNSEAIVGERRISLSPDKPSSVQSSANTTTSSSTTSYEQRKGAGQVLQTYNPNDLKEDDRSQTTSVTKQRCVISTQTFDSTNVQRSYRHMNTNVEEKARILDQQIMDLGAAMKERYGLGKETSQEDNQTGATTTQDADSSVAGLEAVGVPRQEPVCCIGRICNEAQEGRINDTSILLEGCRDESGGARVHLDVSHLKGNQIPFSLFPGQVVAVEGLNTSGRKMVAHRICEGAAPLPVQTTAEQLLKYHHDDDFQAGSPLKIMSVAGPFATPDGLNYQPLWDFMHKVQAESPDVVVMTGPFVDMRQESISKGQTMVQNEDGTETLLPFESFFAEQISAVLQEFFSSENVSTQFVLVPSLDDATAEHVFPQAPLADQKHSSEYRELAKIPGAENFLVGTLDLRAIEAEQGPKRVHCVSNPCTLRINELVISVVSTDVLFHLSAQETNANLPPNTRMERLATHLLKQQSYYPLFPTTQGTNVDLKQLEHFSMPCQPDILIVPSRFMSFARPALDSTLVVNPGFLTKGNTGGSYATIQVHPLARETLEQVGNGSVELAHSVPNRSRVEIKRI